MERRKRCDEKFDIENKVVEERLPIQLYGY